MSESIKVLKYRKFEKNTLKAFFEAELPSGMIIRDLSLHEKNNSRWVGYPARKFAKEDGSEGWINLIYFVDKKVNDRFQKELLTALDRYQGADEQDADLPF